MYKLVNHCLILIFNIFSMMLSFDSVALTHIVFFSQNIILAENVKKRTIISKTNISQGVSQGFFCLCFDHTAQPKVSNFNKCINIS